MSPNTASYPSIPVLDLSALTGDRLVEALASSSCIFLTGHALPDEEFGSLLDTAREFYALDEAEKARVQWSGEPPWRGWQPVYAGGPNAMLLERFELTLRPGGQITADGEPTPLSDWASTFELWPAEPEGFVEAWSRVYGHMHGVASALTTLIAEGLGVPSSDLDAWTTHQHANLVVNHYLAQHEAPAEGRVRQRAHTDIGGVTLLWTDDAPGGLEARVGPNGEWVPVAVPAGAWLVQAGDLLHLWSRGRIPANEHRVVNPPRGEGVTQRSRYSVAYFHHPDLTTWVAPLGGDLPAPGESVSALDHVLKRQQAADGYASR